MNQLIIICRKSIESGLNVNGMINLLVGPMADSVIKVCNMGLKQFELLEQQQTKSTKKSRYANKAKKAAEERGVIK